MYADHRYLHVLTHSFPTRRSSDLRSPCAETMACRAAGGQPCGTPLSVGPIPVRSNEPEGTAHALLSIGFDDRLRSEEHTSELQSLMRISYAAFCLKKKKYTSSICSTTVILQFTKKRVYLYT